ncbi:Mor transcription activator family protein [Shewanella sp. 0m-11]
MKTSANVGHQPCNAVQISEALATTISTYLGGRDIYIPNGECLNDALRDIPIWREFKGNNLEQLSRDYGLTERRVSQIIAEQRAAFVARKQRRFF